MCWLSPCPVSLPSLHVLCFYINQSEILETPMEVVVGMHFIMAMMSSFCEFGHTFPVNDCLNVLVQYNPCVV